MLLQLGKALHLNFYVKIIKNIEENIYVKLWRIILL